MIKTGQRYEQENISFFSSDSESFSIDINANMLIDAFK